MLTPTLTSKGNWVLGRCKRVVLKEKTFKWRINRAKIEQLRKVWPATIMLMLMLNLLPRASFFFRKMEHKRPGDEVGINRFLHKSDFGFTHTIQSPLFALILYFLANTQPPWHHAWSINTLFKVQGNLSTWKNNILSVIFFLHSSSSAVFAVCWCYIW